MTKIHTVEWTPAILNNDIMKRAMQTNWDGILGKIDSPTKKLSDRLPDRLAFYHGIVGLTTERDSGVPYSLTEAFTTVYRMHQLLPDEIVLKSPREQKFGLIDLLRQNSAPLLRKYGLSNWIESFSKQTAGALVLHNFPETLRSLKIPGAPSIDLAAVDVYRDRERGVPRYNRFRELLRLPKAKTFSDITSDPKNLSLLSKIYKSVEDVDAIVGMLAEDRRPQGFAFGETQFRIFVLMASRRLYADPFYTRLYNEKVYTKQGLDWIKRSRLADILAYHFPKSLWKDSKNRSVNPFFLQK